MDLCKYNGSVYKDLEQIPNGDPCQTYFNRDVFCAEQERRPLPATYGAIETLTETAATTQLVLKTLEANQGKATIENKKIIIRTAR